MDKHSIHFDAAEQSEIKYRMFCDLRGNAHATTSYRASNCFRIDPRIREFQYKSEAEMDEERYSEEIAQIGRDLMMTQVRKLAAEHLTKKQLRVFNGLLQGKTPTQMALAFGCSESNIRQTIEGNCKGQGGLIRKLRKLVAKAEKTTSE